MEKVILLVDETPEGIELQRKIIDLIENSELRGTIILPGYIKNPK